MCCAVHTVRNITIHSVHFTLWSMSCAWNSVVSNLSAPIHLSIPCAIFFIPFPICVLSYTKLPVFLNSTFLVQLIIFLHAVTSFACKHLTFNSFLSSVFPHTTNKQDTHAQCPYVCHAVSQEVLYKANMALRTRFSFSVWCILMLSSIGVPKSSESVSCRSTWPVTVLNNESFAVNSGLRREQICRLSGGLGRPKWDAWFAYRDVCE